MHAIAIAIASAGSSSGHPDVLSIHSHRVLLWNLLFRKEHGSTSFDPDNNEHMEIGMKLEALPTRRYGMEFMVGNEEERSTNEEATGGKHYC
jgi:hypothetical protein